MASAAEIVRALYGAWRLARFDPQGLRFFDLSTRGFWASFTAAFVVLPLYALMIGLRYVEGIESGPLWRLAAIKGLAFAISWLAFPVAVAPLVDALNRGRRYIAFVVAYNWAGCIQNALFLVLIVLSDLGAFPGTVGNLILTATFFAVVGYLWFVAKTALEVSALVAAAVVALDFMIGMLIDSLADAMLLRGAG